MIVLNIASTLTILNSEFIFNTATHSGAVFSITSLSMLTITSTEFLSNISLTGSGGSLFLAEVAYALFTNCTWLDNKANLAFGGAIYALKSVISNSVIELMKSKL